MYIKKVLGNIPEVLTKSTLYLLKKADETFVRAFMSSADASKVYELSKDANDPRLYGNLVIYAGDTEVFKITNYDFKTNYEITTERGMFTREEEFINYKAPLLVCLDKLTLNDKVYNLTIIADGVKKPSITYPLNNSILNTNNVLIESSVFELNSGNVGEPQSYEIQISENSNFYNFIKSEEEDGNVRNFLTPKLEVSTTYYARVRHKDLTWGYSEWSDVCTFTTTDNFLPINEEGLLRPGEEGMFGYPVISGNSQRLALRSMKNEVQIFTRDQNGWRYENTIGEKYTEGSLTIPEVSSIAFDYSGSRLVIGNRAYSSAEVWERGDGEWEIVTTLSIDVDDTNNSSFGESVSISDDGSLIAVGNSCYSTNESYFVGAVHIFRVEENAIIPTQSVNQPVLLENNFFGESVHISKSGQTLCVTGRKDPETVEVYFFFLDEASNFVYENKISIGSIGGASSFPATVLLADNEQKLIVSIPNFYSPALNLRGGIFVWKKIDGAWSSPVSKYGTEINFDVTFGTNVSVTQDGKIFTNASFYNSGKNLDLTFFGITGEGITQLKQISTPPPVYRQFVCLSRNGDLLVISGQYDIDDNYVEQTKTFVL